jgi:hypothetical protein
MKFVSDMMKTITASRRKKKIIELSPETEKRLRIIAVNAGYNLKSYIEKVLDEIAEEDELLIILSNAEGTDELLSESEKTRFIKSLSE